MYKHGSLLALFLFPQDVYYRLGKNRFVDCHTQYGMEPFQDHSFFVARNAHRGFARISGWIKYPRKRGKERRNEK